jgi:hypothetical protein
MPDDSDLKLRNIIKTLGISFKPYRSDELAPEQREIFSTIRAIRDKKLDDYHDGLAFQSSEPWKGRTYDRAKWLAGRAADLVNQQRNEAGWRLSLVNDVFHRFGVEVSW